MKALLKINSRAYWKKLLRELLVLDGILLVVLLLYKWNNSILFKLIGMITSMPEEIYAFIGINGDTATANCGFFLSYAAMIMLLWFAWKAGTNTIDVVYENELSGRLFRLCNQLFTKKQLAGMLYLKAVIQFYILYGLWSLSLLVILAIGASNGQQRLNTLASGGRMLVVGAVVLVIYITLAFWYSAVTKSNHSEAFSYRIVFVPWFLANVYKVFDVISWFLQSIALGEWAEPAASIAAVLRKLYWISPISWCNPFTGAMNGMFGLKIVICLVVSGGAFGASLYFFGKKSYEDLMY